MASETTNYGIKWVHSSNGYAATLANGTRANIYVLRGEVELVIRKADGDDSVENFRAGTQLVNRILADVDTAMEYVADLMSAAAYDSAQQYLRDANALRAATAVWLSSSSVVDRVLARRDAKTREDASNETRRQDTKAKTRAIEDAKRFADHHKQFVWVYRYGIADYGYSCSATYASETMPAIARVYPNGVVRWVEGYAPES